MTDFGGRWFPLAKGLGLIVVGLVFALVLIDFWDWTFDGSSVPPALLSLWLLGMAVTCLGYGARSLFYATKA